MPFTFKSTFDGSLTGTDTSIGNISDGRLKKNIEDFTYDVDKFKHYVGTEEPPYRPTNDTYNPSYYQ